MIRLFIATLFFASVVYGFVKEESMDSKPSSMEISSVNYSMEEPEISH